LSRPLHERTSPANLRKEALVELSDVIEDLYVAANLLERAGDSETAAVIDAKAHELETLKKRITP
jgi:predicted DNA-binding protein